MKVKAGEMARAMECINSAGTEPFVRFLHEARDYKLSDGEIMTYIISEGKLVGSVAELKGDKPTYKVVIGIRGDEYHQITDVCGDSWKLFDECELGNIVVATCQEGRPWGLTTVNRKEYGIIHHGRQTTNYGPTSVHYNSCDDLVECLVAVANWNAQTDPLGPDDAKSGIPGDKLSFAERTYDDITDANIMMADPSSLDMFQRQIAGFIGKAESAHRPILGDYVGRCEMDRGG